MPDYSAGTASIRITPDARNFLRDLEAKLRSMRDPNFTVKVEADVSQGRRDTAEWRKAEESNEVDVPVDAETAGATAEMARWRKMQESNPVNVRVVVQHQGARELGQLEKQLESLRRSDLLRLNVGAFGAAAFQPAITALAQVAAGIQQVAQAGIALPGVFAGAAASIGTLVLGLSGIKDAYDAVSDAATSSGKDQEAQARASMSANNALRNANVDLGRAYDDVSRATRDSARELRDLRTEQRGGMIDESRAILEAQKAREDILKGSYTDIRDAALRVAEADQRVIEVRDRNASTAERLNKINETGVSGSDAVVEAQERLVRSQQQVADAQAAAAAAATANSSAQDKAAEAMGKLGPEAQKVVETFVRLKPAFQDFRTAISTPLLEGKAEEFEQFFTTVRPVVETGMAGIARGWNENITSFLGAVGSERGQGLIDRILGNTGDAQAKLSAAMSPLVEGIGTLTAAGTDVLPRLADGLSGVLDRFRDFIVEADSDGRLDKWINDGIDGVRMLGESVLNAGKAFTGITQAAGGGRGFLQWLQDATGRLQTFLNSTEGQNKLREYFEQGREMLNKFMPLLKELPGAFRAIGEGASTYVGGLLPLLTTLADLIGDHPGLVSAAVAAWLAWKTINPIIGGVMNGIGLLNTGLIGIGTNFAGTRGKVDAEMGRINKSFDDAGKPGSKLAGFTSKVGALGAVGGPFGILASTILSVAIPGLLQLGEGMDTAAEKTDNLNERQLALEGTLDRVTGKLTGQSLDSQIAAAQNYAPQGPGAGIPGISKGDALAAATSLGISPDLYGKGLLNDAQAQGQIRDVLTKNNLIPEFAVNPKLSGTASEINALTGGKISQQDVINALIGVPGAVDKYSAAVHEGALASSGGDEMNALALENRLNLGNIAQMLSATGQQSVLAGGALTYLTQQMPTGGPTRQANQARFGSFRLTAEGAGVVGLPPGTVVGATGPRDSPDTQYKVTAPASAGIRADDLQRRGVTAKQNIDGSWELTIPHGSPLIEGFLKGGPTSGPRGKGFLAELHGQEWVHDAGTVDTYGRDVMNAMWRKQIDPKALHGLVPGFEGGGPTDPNDPNYIGIATGQTVGGPAPGSAVGTTHGGGSGPAPVAPNPFSATVPGAVNNISNQLLSGAQNPIQSIASNLFSGFSPQQQSGGSGLTPGLWGLAQAGSDPAMQQAWQQQTANWLMNDWLGGTVMGGLMNSVLPQVLNSVGLGGILNSPYMNAAGQTAGHFAGLAGMNQPNGAVGGMVTLPDGSQVPAAQFLTPGQMYTPNADGTLSTTTVNPALLQQLFPLAVNPAAATSGAGNGGLQTNTILGKQAIQQQFPWATDIGGVRPDALKWHPSGLALDVMIPGAGGLNDPTPAAGKAMGDQMYAWLMTHKDELGIDYIMWQEKDHYNHLHVNFAASGYPAGTPGFAAGGPTPAGRTREFPAILHGDEFVISARGRARVPDKFLHALNQGVVDPKELPQFAVGGDLRDFLRTTMPVPPPTPPPVPDAKMKIPDAISKAPQAQPRPAPPIAATPVPTPAPPVAQQVPSAPPPPVAMPSSPITTDTDVAPPKPTDYTLPWVNQAIDSGAAVAANAASSAIGIAGGGMGMPGAGAIGQFVGGAIMQGGKVVKDVANVISAAMVGSVPGSFMTTPEAYGRTLRPEQEAPQTAIAADRARGGMVQYGPFFGHDTQDVMAQINVKESMHQQTSWAARRRR